MGPALMGRLMMFKGDQFNFHEKPVKANPHCLVCRRLYP
jgi:hypothetical protein